MKLFIKFMIFIVVLACAGPFILKRPDGRPWMTISDLKAPDIATPDISPLTDQVKKLGGSDEENAAAEQTTIFKWQDKDGVWHFSDEASATTPSEEIRINHNANVVHMEKQQTPKEIPVTKSNEQVVQNESKSLDTEVSPYEQLPNLIDKAKNVEKLLDQRQQRQEEILKQLGN